jgi:transcriptional regulator with XRE-family HTH domain
MGRLHAAALRRELGAELRKQRQAAGLSEAQLAHKAGWWAAKISRMESGHINANDIDVVQYLAYCGCFLGEVQDIIDLCRLAEHHHGYWLNSHGQHLEDSVRSLIFHETTASASISYEPHVVPGLLQTVDYARAVIRRFGSRTEENVEFCVQARLERQRILHRPSPGQYTFFIHEHALRAMVGSAAIMHDQMLKLALFTGLPHIEARVVPASIGERSIFGGSFLLLHYRSHRPLVYLDGQVACLFLEEGDYVAGFTRLVPAIADVALDEGESRELIAILANEYDRGSARDHVEEEQP